ncbi:hypothetical protein MIB92_10010 [Aestuariirhabdus sp. Z084]|uniref:hypothetical protein n=1 Tax=Aestuariirhabdus haliotis TaxID=2918751 RepID=UPI00201B37EE|nr:hypothetical protein [Aestuariirhabdus haliotis]MCL6415987.1 hypothetical protein [Aestuariirhabdus haliotis]MCL6419980.1 hypothetical protein [Aestuariirhabdus haliotis]
MLKTTRLLAVLSLSLSSSLLFANKIETIDAEFLAKTKEQFMALDSQNLGYLSYEQARVLMPSVADQIDKVDLNRDGQVTWTEVEHTLRSFNDALDSRAAKEIRELDYSTK